ncbi:MAG: protein-L-isoaspartate(D-aspartate) O-methyltransferase [Phycisphaerae bacterium]
MIGLLLIAGSACRKTKEQDKPKGPPAPPKHDTPEVESSNTVASTNQPVGTLPPLQIQQPSRDDVSEPAEDIRPRTEERAEERLRMVERQIKAHRFRNKQVLEAMTQVPRHWFVPDEYQRFAYSDHPLPIGYDQTIAQPYVVALTTKLLDVEPGDKILVIGTGSGYQAAVLAELTDQVFIIENIEPLAERTARLFEEKGYLTIQTRVGDGNEGWPEEAPFDAMIVSCAPDAVPPLLVQQLEFGGRMCIPVAVGETQQNLILMEKDWEGDLIRQRIEAVTFAPLTPKKQAGRQ